MLIRKLLAVFKKAFKKKKRRRQKFHVKKRHAGTPRRPRGRRRKGAAPKNLKKTRRPKKQKRRPGRKNAPTQEKFLGEVTHYFPKVRAAVIKLKRKIEVGMPVVVRGRTGTFRQTVASLEIERKPVVSAGAGQEVGLEVLREVKPGDKIFSFKP